MPPKTERAPTRSNNGVKQPGPKKRASFRESNNTAPLWDDVPAEVLAFCVRMCTTQGASPTFGYTRSGAFLTLAVYWKGERAVEYLPTSEEAVEYILFLAREWFELSDEELAEYDIGPRLMA